MGPSTGGWILYRTLAAPRLAAEPVVLIEPYAAETGEDVRMSRQEYQDWVAQEPSATAWTTAGHGNPRTPPSTRGETTPQKGEVAIDASVQRTLSRGGSLEFRPGGCLRRAPQRPRAPAMA